jgi:hypothetical protein
MSRRRALFWVAIVIGAMLLIVAFNRSLPVPSERDGDQDQSEWGDIEPALAKSLARGNIRHRDFMHNPRTEADGEWKAEVWSEGSAFRPNNPISFGIRVSSQVSKDRTPVVSAQFSLLSNDRNATFCVGAATLNMVREDGSLVIDIVRFGGKSTFRKQVYSNDFFEARANNVLTIRDQKTSTPLKEGNYKADVILTIGDSHYSFQDMPIAAMFPRCGNERNWWWWPFGS